MYIRLWQLFEEDSDASQAEDGDLKLTENSFTLDDDDGKQTKCVITLESVLVGEQIALIDT